MDDNGDIISKNKPKIQESLWVDKYTSHKFFDLLTNEVTNRNVLTWLKTWDELVFPTKPKVNLRIPDQILQRSNNSSNLSKSSLPNFLQQQQEKFSHHFKKVLLLYGPPGTGKSTMARVLARQCGYEPLEINASDERTGEQILNKIKSAISQDDFFTKNKQANPFIKSDQTQTKKPVCLIVDEVDGALGSSLDSTKGIGQIVEYLKKCINYSLTKTKDVSKDDEEIELAEVESDTAAPSSENEPKKPNRKNKDTDIVQLKRPIIFICNDMYSRVLAPLRDIALQLKIEESSPERLLSRLRIICRQENVLIDD